ncbi:hypothetical protein [Mycoplasmopsis glycophila]|uniref:Lipoprotein n=1 Tax=Mycoplasmopsis glycophila TaxID=171285 RepID=A0A449AUA8_9BACT|nr:hypothetical protein [Mycoplasmopsis glycophila]VEU70109.1 Uncharacterised protein [Mycoplasmopsis glycophila]
MFKKKLLFFLSFLSLPTIFWSSACNYQSNQNLTNEEFLKLLRERFSASSFKPRIKLDSNENLATYTIENLYDQGKIDWEEFEQTVEFNNSKVTVIGKLSQIEYSPGGSTTAKFTYIWKLKNSQIARASKYTILNGLKPVEYRSEPYCHFGHCHPRAEGAQVIIINTPN